MIDLELVAAVDQAGGLGKGGKLPWRLRGDTAFFKRLTSTTEQLHHRNAVIMGRKTWQSIPTRFRPLPGRLNVVLSRTRELSLPDEVLLAPSIEAALTEIERRGDDVERVFVVGGGEIYRLAIDHPRCRRCYLTRVQGRFACDTFLPDLPADFRLVEQSDPQQDGEIGYRFETYQR